MGLWITTSEDFVRALRAALPTGIIWTRDPSRRLSRFLLGLGDELSRTHTLAGGIIAEADPSTATDAGMLSDWERVTNSREGHFAEVYPVPTEDDRRGAVLFKLRNRGGQSLAYFENMAHELGASDAAAYDDTTPFTWRMSLPSNVIRFRAGTGRAGDPLVTFDALAKRVAFYVERYKPAHTVVMWTD
jgi:uncharacterized protein YmfQ (DUF2313 family)